jgi:hypothetical protein
MVTKASLVVGTRTYIFYILPSGGEPYWALSSFADCVNDNPRHTAFYAKHRHEKSWAKLHAELFPDAVVAVICVGPDEHSHANRVAPCGVGEELMLPEPACQVSMFITIWMWCVMSQRRNTMTRRRVATEFSAFIEAILRQRGAGVQLLLPEMSWRGVPTSNYSNTSSSLNYGSWSSLKLQSLARMTSRRDEI